MSAVYCALVHWPVLDRNGRTVTTAVTNLDVHDLARSARTYDLSGYFVVTPITAQRALVARIIDHWRTGPGASRVPERGDALRLCMPVASVEQACAEIANREGRRPRLLLTAARRIGRETSAYADVAREIPAWPEPVLIAFGTGHGFAAEAMMLADYLLAPIRPDGSYNHLSVRAAATVVFDRLFGDEGSARLTAP